MTYVDMTHQPLTGRRQMNARMRRVVELVETLENLGISLDEVERLVMGERAQSTKPGAVRVYSASEIAAVAPIIMREHNERRERLMMSLKMGGARECDPKKAFYSFH